MFFRSGLAWNQMRFWKCTFSFSLISFSHFCSLTSPGCGWLEMQQNIEQEELLLFLAQLEAGGSRVPGSFLAKPSDSRGSSKLQASHSLPELPSAATSLAGDGVCDVAPGTLQFMPTSAKISLLSTEKIFHLITPKKTTFPLVAKRTQPEKYCISS